MSSLLTGDHAISERNKPVTEKPAEKEAETNDEAEKRVVRKRDPEVAAIDKILAILEDFKPEAALDILIYAARRARRAFQVQPVPIEHEEPGF